MEAHSSYFKFAIVESKQIEKR